MRHQLFRYLQHLPIKAKSLSFKIVSSTQRKSKAKKIKKPHRNWVKSVTELCAMADLEFLGTNMLENYL